MTACGIPESWTEYVKGELASDRMESLSEHLAVCPTCTEEVRQLRLVLQGLGSLPEVEPSAAFLKRLDQRLAAATARQRPLEARLHRAPFFKRLWWATRRQWASIPGWALSACGHLLVFALLFWLLTPPPVSSPDEVIRYAPGEDLEPPPLTENVPPPLSPLTEEARRQLQRHLKGVRELRLDPAAQRDTLREVIGDDGLALLEEGLRWLAAQQQEEGGAWDPVPFSGRQGSKTLVTGLALLPFLVRGELEAEESPFATVVEEGLNYLASVQQPDGCLGTGRDDIMFTHSVACLCLMEASWADGDQWEDAARAAVAFLVAQQSPRGGWGEERHARWANMRVTVWAYQSLQLATFLEYPLAETTMLQAERWLAARRGENGLYAYSDPYPFPLGPYYPTAAGASLQSWALLEPRDEAAPDEAARTTLDWLLAKGQGPDEKDPLERDFSAWHFSALALWGFSDERAAAFLREGASRLAGRVGDNGIADRWELHGGRLYSTCFALLFLETPIRYPREG